MFSRKTASVAVYASREALCRSVFARHAGVGRSGMRSCWSITTMVCCCGWKSALTLDQNVHRVERDKSPSCARRGRVMGYAMRRHTMIVALRAHQEELLVEGGRLGVSRSGSPRRAFRSRTAPSSSAQRASSRAMVCCWRPKAASTRDTSEAALPTVIVGAGYGDGSGDAADRSEPCGPDWIRQEQCTQTATGAACAGGSATRDATQPVQHTRPQALQRARRLKRMPNSTRHLLT
jgi:hypothetical protein